ncbi:DUF262 domain-containing protein [Anaerolineales bacterium HSG25]|nr:DUF262 domain-containing protein [Anaerolineales bacterium HSG25]
MSTALLTELNEQKRKVDFDSFDMSVKQLINMVEEWIIDIAPIYQRKFRWESDRQSELVESIFLGIPVPNLFMAANADGTWEVIDGVQRLSSLIHFAGNEGVRKTIGLDDQLKLTKLDELSSFNGKFFHELPQTIQLQFLLKPIKVTTLSDKSNKKVRFDLFERLNTGGVKLTSQEIRAAVYRGQFNEMFEELADKSIFRAVVKIAPAKENDGTPQETVLRFFAYYHEYQNFTGSVKGFLNNYMEKASRKFDYRSNIELFEYIFSQLSQILPNGITRPNRTTTPMSLYEAVTVGAALAYTEKGKLITDGIEQWMHSDELYELTTGSTNSKKQVIARIEYCRDKFMGE